MSDIEAHFWELCDRAQQHDRAHYRNLCDDSVSPDEAQASEHAMVEIIKLVESHPEHRETFVRCFSDVAMWRRPAPYLLVAFCMRRLRFPEIPELLSRDAEAHKGTAYYAKHMNYWSAISHAYLDKVWESAICFDFYRHEANEDESQRPTSPCT